MLFWILTAALAALIALPLGLALWRSRAGAAPDTASDLGIYRDQLRAVDAELARGVTSADEAARLRLEISRRLLEADRNVAAQSPGGPAPAAATALAALAVLAAMAGAFVLYQQLGAPGYEDMPLRARLQQADRLYDTRPGQQAAEAEAAARRAARPAPDPQLADLIGRLREAVASRPDDPVGLDLLARNEALLGNYHAAWTTQQRLIAAKGDSATVNDLQTMAEMMISATGGVITPEIEAVLADVMANDPGNGTALFYLGLMMAQNDRPDRTFAIWSALLAKGPESAPWIAPIRRSIRDLAWLAGETGYEPPTPVAIGPSSAEIAAAAALAPEGREAALRVPTQALMAQMAATGGTADEWSRLLGALAALGERDRAATIWAEAQQVFAERPDDLALIGAAAAAAGLAGAEGALRGPTQTDIADTAALTPEAQADFIKTMVDGLAARLASTGGTAAEWAQLIGALDVLGETARARAAWADAQAAFADRPAELQGIRAAAVAAGVAE